MPSTHLATPSLAECHPESPGGVKDIGSRGLLARLAAEGISGEAADFLAEPMERHGRVEWYTSLDGEAVPLERLEGADRDSAPDAVCSLAAGYSGLSDRLEGSGAASLVSAGRLTRRVAASASATDPAASPGTGLATAAVQAPPPAPPESADDERGRRAFPPWLLGSLLALLLLLLAIALPQLLHGGISATAPATGELSAAAGTDGSPGAEGATPPTNSFAGAPGAAGATPSAAAPGGAPGDDLVIPEGAEDVGFLEGCWQSGGAIVNTRTRLPVIYVHCFDSGGNARVTIDEKTAEGAHLDTCVSTATASIEGGGRLVIRSSPEGHRCERARSRSYGPTTVSCVREGSGKASCVIEGSSRAPFGTPFVRLGDGYRPGGSSLGERP
jgi:hypothetical protein